MAKISVQDTPITVLHIEEQDYISLTDMAAAKEGENRVADIIKNWIRNRYTIEFLGTWEMIHNPDFKVVEFDHFKMNAGLHSFVLSSSEWVERTNAIGIFVKRGRYGGTYAHKDIAFEFGSAISDPFKLYLINEFQRLKAEEQRQFGWSVKRELAKINYRIHTSAIRQNLMPLEVTSAQANMIYANEADVLNVAMFGLTAKQWREANPTLKGNIRDYATINEYKGGRCPPKKTIPVLQKNPSLRRKAGRPSCREYPQRPFRGQSRCPDRLWQDHKHSCRRCRHTFSSLLIFKGYTKSVLLAHPGGQNIHEVTYFSQKPTFSRLGIVRTSPAAASGFGKYCIFVLS